MTTLNLQVGAGTDDARESFDGTMTLGGTAIAIGNVGADRHAGFRFAGVSGLSGSTINSTHLQFYASATDSGGFEGDFYAHDAEAPGTFTTTAYNITDVAQRPRTTATVEADSSDFGNWTLGNWYSYPTDGTIDIKTIIQELADSYDPSAIAILFIYAGSLTGERMAKSYEGDDALAAKLDIDYTAGGEDVTVTPPTATLTTATFAPVIKLVVIPAKRTLSLATFTPVLGLSVIPPPLALSLTAFAPTVTATANVTVTPGVCTLSLGLFVPTVTATANVTVIPGVIALSLTTFAPTVTVTGDVVVTPGVLALTLTTFAPVIKIVITPPTLALNLQTFAPTISTPRLVTPSTATLSLAAFAPTVSAPRLVTPGVASLSISVFAPTVTVTGDMIVTPGVLTLSLGLFAPTVFTPCIVTPGVVALSLAFFVPTITVAPVFTAVWLDDGTITLLLVQDGSVSLPGAVNAGTISIKETEDATIG